MLFTSWTALLMTERWGLPNEIKRKNRPFSFKLLRFVWHAVTILEFMEHTKPLHLPLVLCPQPALIAWSPWPFLRSARSCLWPWWPAVVYFNSSGETDSGEPPHPSPPGQGCLHGQTLHGGRRGRRRVTVTAAGAWTFITGRLVCSLLVCL